MFPNAERCNYTKNQILETVCQLRFPTILSVEANLPADFQDAIRDVFPRYECRKEQPAPKITAVAGQPAKVEQQPVISNHTFLSADNTRRINLTQNFIALTVQNYTCWEDFAKLLDQALAEFIRIYKPAYFERVGLRYVNAVSRNALDIANTPWRELIEDKYLGLMADEAMAEQNFLRCSQDVETNLPGGCRMKLHAGPGLVRRGNDTSDKEAKYVLDIDVSMSGNVPINISAGAMNILHTHAYNVFRDAITDTLHDAMEPQEV